MTPSTKPLFTLLTMCGLATSLMAAPPPGKGGGGSGGATIAEGTYVFLANHSGKAMTASGTANGSSVAQWTANGQDTQLWQVTGYGNGEYKILNTASGRALDVSSASTSEDAPIIVWDSSGAANQRWTFQDQGNGYYSMHPVHDSGKCAQVSGASQTDGAAVVQHTYNGTTNQLWLLQQQSAFAKVACVGDSITAGYGLSSPSTESYPAQLQGLLGPNYHVDNWGQSGATALKRSDLTYWNSSQYRDSLQSNPNIVIIMLGTNDSKPSNWNETRFKNDLGALIDKYAALASNPDVYVCLIPPVYEPTAFGNDFSTAFIQNVVVPAINDISLLKGTPLIDNNTNLLDHPQWFPDGVHPTVTGAGAIAQNVADAIIQNVPSAIAP